MVKTTYKKKLHRRKTRESRRTIHKRGRARTKKNKTRKASIKKTRKKFGIKTIKRRRRRSRHNQVGGMAIEFAEDGTPTCGICLGQIMGLKNDLPPPPPGTAPDGRALGMVKIQSSVATNEIAAVYEQSGEGEEFRSHEITVPPEGLFVTANHFVYHKRCIDIWIDSKDPPTDPYTNAIIVPIPGPGPVTVHDGADVDELRFHGMRKFRAYQRTVQNVKDVSFAEGITRIGNNAFLSYISLETVVIPEGVVEIGEDAFANCRKLKNVTFPRSLKKIGNAAFDGCIGLKEIKLQDTDLVSVGDNAFHHCTNLWVTSFPSTLESIGSGAFSLCIELAEINLKETQLVKVMPETFKGCPWFSEFFAPPTLESIGDRAFMNNRINIMSLQDTNLKDVGIGAFADNQILWEIQFPSTLKVIAGEAFIGCIELEKVDLSQTQITQSTLSHSAFDGCEYLRAGPTGLNLPDGVTYNGR